MDTSCRCAFFAAFLWGLCSASAEATNVVNLSCDRLVTYKVVSLDPSTGKPSTISWAAPTYNDSIHLIDRVTVDLDKITLKFQEAGDPKWVEYGTPAIGKNVMFSQLFRVTSQNPDLSEQTSISIDRATGGYSFVKVEYASKVTADELWHTQSVGVCTSQPVF